MNDEDVARALRVRQIRKRRPRRARRVVAFEVGDRPGQKTLGGYA